MAKVPLCNVASSTLTHNALRFLLAASPNEGHCSFRGLATNQPSGHHVGSLAVRASQCLSVIIASPPLDSARRRTCPPRRCIDHCLLDLNNITSRLPGANHRREKICACTIRTTQESDLHSSLIALLLFAVSALNGQTVNPVPGSVTVLLAELSNIASLKLNRASYLCHVGDIPGAGIGSAAGF